MDNIPFEYGKKCYEIVSTEDGLIISEVIWEASREQYDKWKYRARLFSTKASAKRQIHFAKRVLPSGI